MLRPRNPQAEYPSSTDEEATRVTPYSRTSPPRRHPKQLHPGTKPTACGIARHESDQDLTSTRQGEPQAAIQASADPGKKNVLRPWLLAALRSCLMLPDSCNKLQLSFCEVLRSVSLSSSRPTPDLTCSFGDPLNPKVLGY